MYLRLSTLNVLEPNPALGLHRCNKQLCLDIILSIDKNPNLIQCIHLLPYNVYSAGQPAELCDITLPP